ncbi:MAG: PQQ-like beta-propeller repeat protein [Opitutaceae bacterium]|nr:PQQ-like beta-propeller repeat protein [Opitutaceae bacterium]
MVAFAFPSHAADWPHWRGPARNGISNETGWLDQWPAGGPVIAWRAQVGLGPSSFVVADSRAFTMGHADGHDTVFCFEAATGKVIWKHRYPAELGDKFFEGGTTGTPTVDGDRLYVLSRWGDAFCFEAASGRIVWSVNVRKETGIRVPDWGFTGAPLVLEGRVILNVGEAGVALDKSTGKILWQSADKNAGYSTPIPVELQGRTLVLLGSSQSYLAVNPSDGKEAWRVRWVTEYGVNAADPIVSDGRLFVSSGYAKGAALFALGGSEPEELWRIRSFRTQLNAAVLHEGHLYGVDGDTTSIGSLKCLEFATGTEKWAHKEFRTGAVSMAAGRLIAISGTGTLMIAPASPTAFTPTATAKVLEGKCWTAPVLANGLIYCRNTSGDVVVLDVRKK